MAHRRGCSKWASLEPDEFGLLPGQEPESPTRKQTVAWQKHEAAEKAAVELAKSPSQKAQEKQAQEERVRQTRFEQMKADLIAKMGKESFESELAKTK